MKPTKVSIGWSAGTSVVSQLIRRLECSAFNHVYWRFDFGDSGSLIYESHFTGGVQITPYDHLMAAKRRGQVYKIHEVDTGLTGFGPSLLWADCLPYHGARYDTTRILGYYLWTRLRGRRGQPHLHMPDRYTCNEFVVASGRQMVELMAGCDYSYTPERLYKLFHYGRGSRDLIGEDSTQEPIRSLLE